MKRLLLPIALFVVGGIIYAASTPHAITQDQEDITDTCTDASYDTVASEDIAIPDTNLAPFQCVIDTLSDKDEEGYAKSHYYFFYDITADGNSELWLTSGSCEANTELWCYTIENGKARKILNGGGSHAHFYEFEGKLRCESCNAGGGTIYTYEYKKGKIRVKKHGYGNYMCEDGPKYKDKEARRIVNAIYSDSLVVEFILKEIPNNKQ